MNCHRHIPHVCMHHSQSDQCSHVPLPHYNCDTLHLGKNQNVLQSVQFECINSLCQCLCHLLCLCYFSIQFPQMSPNLIRLHQNLAETPRILPQQLKCFCIPQVTWFSNVEILPQHLFFGQSALMLHHVIIIWWSCGKWNGGKFEKEQSCSKFCHSTHCFTKAHIKKWQRHSLRQRHWHSELDVSYNLLSTLFLQLHLVAKCVTVILQ